MNARWWTLRMGLSESSITHRLKFIRHQPCAKWWARWFSILEALWSPLGDGGDLESSGSIVGSLALTQRLLEVKRTLYISGETSQRGLTGECPCGKWELGQQRGHPPATLLSSPLSSMRHDDLAFSSGNAEMPFSLSLVST